MKITLRIHQRRINNAWMPLPAKEGNDYLRKAIAEKFEKDSLLPA